jgi:TonB family protein
VQAEGTVPDRDLAGPASRSSAQGGGELSQELAADLVLEVVLNEVAEQACLATGATGAAIVLRRNGKMVCRASSGETAPELGSPLDTSSGLSGECVRTRRTQCCDDTLADTRVDAQASLRLGVRSVMVMPLLRGEELLGVFELFSSRPSAFGDRDERTLEALATRALANFDPRAPTEVASASEQLGIRREGSEDAALSKEILAEELENPVTGPEVEVLGQDSETAATGGFEFLTWALAAAVLACAVLLGVLLGRHLGGEKGNVRPRAAVLASAPMSAPVAAATPASASSPTKQETAPRPAASSKTRDTSSVPPGGLLVFENGKEIFRMPPTPGEPVAGADRELGIHRAASLEAENTAQQQVVQLSPAEAEDGLISRVEPEYPEEARQQGIAGAVVLEVRISVEGRVKDVRLVSGAPQLARAATDAVKQWRFQPRTSQGRPAEAQTQVTLNFKLPR